AVSSIDTKVDAVGACVGVRGSRIKNIVDELGGEKIDIVRWNESSQILIQNALKPAEVTEVSLCFELGRATVVVNEDQLSLAIGKRGQNVRLAARLTGWDVDILTPVEFQNGVKRLEETLKSVEGFPADAADKVIALGVIDVRDIDEVGAEPLMEELGLTEELAQIIVERCASEAKVVAAEQERKKSQMMSSRGTPDLAKLIGMKGVDASGAQEAVQHPQAVQEPTDIDAQAASAAEDDAAGSDRMPGALESVAGGSAEVMVHKEESLTSSDDLSPEEQAVQVASGGRPEDEKDRTIDDEPDTAALAEGRVDPPASAREGNR
ncbi:MAG: hypothetical protein ACAI43_04545, partial [Phycisphaerae bacterium]